MRKPGSICKFVCAAVIPLLCACALRPSPRNETPAEQPREAAFDPLGLPQDTVIVTFSNSAAEARLQKKLRESRTMLPAATADSSALPDSLNHQIYRVQLLTADSYSDARKDQAVAEEIFDQPLSLNYDLPYYKLRVGEFATKAEADAYLLRARAAGYVNAWVVLTNVGIRELKPLYDVPTPSSAPDTTTKADDKHD